MALWLAFRDVIDLVTPFEDIIMDGAPAPATAFSDVATTALVSAMTENADGSGSLLIASSTIPHGLATAFTVSAQGALPSWKLCDLKTNKSVAVSASGEATWSSSAEGGSLFLLAAITPCHAVARAAPAAVVWGVPTLISTHLGRSDADTFHAGFAADPNVVLGSTHSGDREITIQSTDGGLTFAELWQGPLGSGGPYGWVNGSLQSTGNCSRFNNPAVSELQGNTFSVIKMAASKKSVTRGQHCCPPGSPCSASSPYAACGADERISWSGFPSPTMSFTLYSGNIITLANGRFGKSATICNNPVPSAARPYGCTLVPRHDPSTGRLSWGARNLSVWWFTSSDAKHWRYTSVVASTAQCQALGLAAEEGPNEPAVSLLADAKTLIAVMRRDGGDGWPSHKHLPYIKSLSTNHGRTWSDPVPMEKTVLSARPML